MRIVPFSFFFSLRIYSCVSLASSLLGSGGEPVGRPIQRGRHKCVAHHDSDPKVKSHNCNHVTTRREGRWRDAGSAFIGGPLTYRRASVCHAQIDFFFPPSPARYLPAALLTHFPESSLSDGVGTQPAYISVDPAKCSSEKRSQICTSP